ncbi:copper amine oxidase N-terminal domain-containing protein [Paenibacillus sp. OVF10]|nr:copper amine oxidase N-terminal domain-containing protein [Paenibacillus sp. OVF10]
MTWNSKSQTVKATNTVKGQTTEVLLQVGSTTATVNGKKLRSQQHLSSGRDAYLFH